MRNISFPQYNCSWLVTKQSSFPKITCLLLVPKTPPQLNSDSLDPLPMPQSCNERGHRDPIAANRGHFSLWVYLNGMLLSPSTSQKDCVNEKAKLGRSQICHWNRPHRQTSLMHGTKPPTAISVPSGLINEAHMPITNTKNSVSFKLSLLLAQFSLSAHVVWTTILVPALGYKESPKINWLNLDKSW